MEKSKGENDADCRPDIWHVGPSPWQAGVESCQGDRGGGKEKEGKVEVLLLLLIWFE